MREVADPKTAKMLPDGKVLLRTQLSEGSHILYSKWVTSMYPAGDPSGEHLYCVSLGASFLVTTNIAGTNKDVLFVVV